MTNKLAIWGKRLITGFFILIFTLGFFSKSLMNLTLPNVQIAQINDGVEVNYTSELSGQIVAKKTEDICILGDAVIQEVYAKKGGYVIPGTPLFKIDMRMGLQNKEDPTLLKSKIQTEKERMHTMRSKSEVDYQTNLSQVTANLKQAETELRTQQELLKSGAVTQEAVHSAENRLSALKAEKETLANQFNLQQAQDQVAINEIKGLINNYETQLKLIEAGKNQYFDVNPLGEVFAKSKGYILKLPEKGTAYKSGETIASVGICNTYKDLAFEMGMSLKTFNSMKNSAYVIRLTTQEGDYIGMVAADYELSSFSDGEMKVMASFTDEPDKQIYPGQTVVSRSNSSTTIGGEVLAVPKSAVVVSGTMEGDTNGLIYLIREEEDALGKSQIAVAIPVNVKSVGDEYAVITELRNIPSNKIIINPTAKIKDGTKVYVCP